MQRAKEWRDRERDRTRDRERERERDPMLLRTGHGVSNKLGRWTNIYYSYSKDNPRSYQDHDKDYLQEFSSLLFL
jgi:hypothetical protein